MRLGIDAGARSVEAAKECGIGGVAVDASELAARGVDAVLAPLRVHGIEICQIGAFGYNPLHPDRTLRRRQEEMVRTALAMAPQTGCRYVAIAGGNRHPSGFAHGDPYNFGDEALEEIAREVAPLAAVAEERGVCLSMEPYVKSALWSPQRCVRLCEMVGSAALRINLDVANFYDLGDMWDSRAAVRSICDGLARHVGLMHVKDVRLREGFHVHIDLAPLGEGVTDWAHALACAASCLPQDSWVILEHVADVAEAARSAALLRDAARRADVALR